MPTRHLRSTSRCDPSHRRFLSVAQRAPEGRPAGSHNNRPGGSSYADTARLALGKRTFANTPKYLRCRGSSHPTEGAAKSTSLVLRRGVGGFASHAFRAEIAPMLANRTNLAEAASTLPTPGHSWPISPGFGRFRPICTTSNKCRSKSPRLRSKSDTFRPTSSRPRSIRPTCGGEC